MRRQFKLSITSFDLVGGIHFYGSVYLNGVKIHECDQPDPRPLPSHWTNDAMHRRLWRTIAFATALDVVQAAKKWFLAAPEVQPGDRLVVRAGYFKICEIAEIERHYHGCS